MKKMTAYSMPKTLTLGQKTVMAVEYFIKPKTKLIIAIALIFEILLHLINIQQHSMISSVGFHSDQRLTMSGVSTQSHLRHQPYFYFKINMMIQKTPH
ncbi:hypothetical protein ACSYAF_13220 [Edwardsiella tarda]|uniref:hypothetical protein n=1 Tax=Edwardsiella tarda TaxID=636 RepID=UPI00266FBC70|nr:hypothetical protein [Edwardsiella tarda]WKS80710.1 hypothetical protein NHU85_13390 [Edwardsiella tarda]